MPNGLVDYKKLSIKELILILVERQAGIAKKMDQHVEVYHSKLSIRITTVEAKVSKLQGFRMWILGAIAVAGVAITVALRIFA